MIEETVLLPLQQGLGSIEVWITDSLLPVVVALLVAASAIYLAFIGWRAYKAAVNKV